MSDVEQARREDPGVRSRLVLACALGFVAFAILLGGGLRLYYRWIVSGQKLTAPLVAFPAPELQPNPTRDWESFHKAQVDDLVRPAATGSSQTPARLPIDRAKALVIARGAQGYDPVEGTPPFHTAIGAPLDGAPRATPAPMAAPYGDVH